METSLETPLETPLETRPQTPLEMELQRGWASAPPARLREDSGREWRVLFAGTWNHGPGPDFRDALLLPAWGPALRGDVEIHRRPAGWHAHGHDADPAYARVLFQLSADRPPGLPPGPGAARAGPRRPAPPRDAQLVRGLPAAPPPCAQVVQRGGRAAVVGALRRLSRERLLAKAGRLRARTGTRRRTRPPTARCSPPWARARWVRARWVRRGAASRGSPIACPGRSCARASGRGR